ncbi:MAG: patatin-like phospholipase family protein [Candidatus Kuenenbacteria bacterium]
MHKIKLKIGLALGSGGVKGLAHIGVIKVLEENNIPIDFIAGTSIGALVGAHYAAYRDIKKIEEIVLSTNWRTSLAFFDPVWKGGFVKGNKLENLIKSWFKEASFNNLKIPLIIVATDLITGQEADISRGDLIKAIRASGSIPTIFKPVKLGKQLLADGGLSNPLPDDVARQMGSDIVIAVNLDNNHFENDLTSENISLLKVSTRALNIMRCHLAQNCLKTADVIIEPRVRNIGLIGWNRFFKNREAMQIIKAGEDAAIKLLPKIRSLMDKDIS